jgi:hypothetical protein
VNKDFKYQDDYDKLQQTCPPNDYIQKDIDTVFRWVFDTINDDRNFISQFHKDPKRFLNKDDLTKCKALGLSFFNNLDGSTERFQELKDFIGETVYSTLGTQLSKGSIKFNDGVNGGIERLGHFTHHSSSTANYKNEFTLMNIKL